MKSVKQAMLDYEQQSIQTNKLYYSTYENKLGPQLQHMNPITRQRTFDILRMYSFPTSIHF